jgi:hypothetical protein
VRLVEDLDQRAAGEHAVADCDTVHHRPGRPIPLRHHEHIARTQRVDGLLESRTALEGLAGHLLGEDLVASLGAECAQLAIQFWAAELTLA